MDALTSSAIKGIVVGGIAVVVFYFLAEKLNKILMGTDKKTEPKK